MICKMAIKTPTISFSLSLERQFEEAKNGAYESVRQRTGDASAITQNS